LCAGSLKDKKAAVLGAAFKPDSDDVRDSPALDVARELQGLGAIVTIYDPQANSTAAQRLPSATYADSTQEAVSGAEVVLLLTEWNQFRSLDPLALKDLVAQPIMIDGRNVLDRQLWADSGWTIHSLGRGTLS
jgi:UDPglucose 6-dehydrogenase